MNQDRSLQQKLKTTAIIVLLYRLGCNAVLPWLRAARLEPGVYDLQAYAQMTAGTNTGSGTIFALGIMPYISASILVQLFTAMTGGKQKGFSKERQKRRIRFLAFIIACMQLFFTVPGMEYIWDLPRNVLYGLTAVFLLSGVFFMTLLMEKNERDGIGGHSSIILANILSTVGKTIVRPMVDELTRSRLDRGSLVFLVFSLLIVVLTIFFEKTELHIPMRRIGISSELEGKDYLAIKWNPAGTMPAIYVMMLFSLPVLLFRFLAERFPGQKCWETAAEALDLNSLTGVGIFLLAMILMIFLMAFIMVSPKKIAENLQKSGDYLDGIRAGEETRKYLKARVLGMAVLSSFTMSLMAGIPLIWRLLSRTASPLFIAPISLMLMTSIISRIFDEVEVEQLLTDYRPFL